MTTPLCACCGAPDGFVHSFTHHPRSDRERLCSPCFWWALTLGVDFA